MNQIPMVTIQPLKLNNSASGHYASLKTGVRNKQRKKYGIEEEVDRKHMDQIQEGKTSFNRLPEEAVDVQIFPQLLNALMSCGKNSRNRI